MNNRLKSVLSILAQRSRMGKKAFAAFSHAFATPPWRCKTRYNGRALGTTPFNGKQNQHTDFVVEMITAPILYGSPFDAGRRSSRRPTQPSVGTEAGTRIDAPRSDTP